MGPCIALYGPPGAGKSTIVQAALAQGIAAVDLESVGMDHAARLQGLRALLTEGKTMLFGAADIAPEHFSASTKFVLLLPPLDVLVRRVVQRGDRHPHKWLTHAHTVYGEHAKMAANGVFHMTIDEDLTPEDTVAKLMRYVVVGKN